MWAEAGAAAAEVSPGTFPEGAGKSLTPSSAVSRVEFGLSCLLKPTENSVSCLLYLKDRDILGKESILISWSLPWVQAGVGWGVDGVMSHVCSPPRREQVVKDFRRLCLGRGHEQT